MLVRMKKTEKGSPDGVEIKTYEEGEDYDLNPSLARQFLLMEVAEEVSMDPESNDEDLKVKDPEDEGNGDPDQDPKDPEKDKDPDPKDPEKEPDPKKSKGGRKKKSKKGAPENKAE